MYTQNFQSHHVVTPCSICFGILWSVRVKRVEMWWKKQKRMSWQLVVHVHTGERRENRISLLRWWSATRVKILKNLFNLSAPWAHLEIIPSSRLGFRCRHFSVSHSLFVLSMHTSGLLTGVNERREVWQKLKIFENK